MDLDPVESWLKLNQQPYSLVNEFLKQLSSADVKQDVAPLIEHCLVKHQARILTIRTGRRLSTLVRRHQPIGRCPRCCGGFPWGRRWSGGSC